MYQRKRISSADDAQVLNEIRTVLSTRPTYGYRRVTAVVNAHRHQQGNARINHKRIYRVMKANHLKGIMSG